MRKIWKSYHRIEEFCLDTVTKFYRDQAMEEGVSPPDKDFLREQSDVLLLLVDDAIDEYFANKAAPLPTEETV